MNMLCYSLRIIKNMNLLRIFQSKFSENMQARATNKFILSSSVN